jgi:dinuclear metal center YbgI/SA1388 family protein
MNASELILRMECDILLSYQSSWDNSGLLVNSGKEIKKAVVSLDISRECIEFAKENNAQVIVSHHPVIFDAVKSVDSQSALYKLIQSDISAICMHTPLDVSKKGMNYILYNLMKNDMDFKGGYKIFEPTQSEEIGFGFITDLSYKNDTRTIAQKLKDILSVQDVRYYDSLEPVKTVAVCSGSGASMLEYAKECGVDTLITGDVKHDRWIAAADMKMNLIDCGHYYTENVCLPYLEELIKLADDNIEVLRFEKEPYEVV